jgi:hypothetical protein
VSVDFRSELFERLSGIGLLLMGIDAKLEELIGLFESGDDDEEEEANN